VFDAELKTFDGEKLSREQVCISCRFRIMPLNLEYSSHVFLDENVTAKVVDFLGA
jgi:hypothetical protein